MPGKLDFLSLLFPDKSSSPTNWRIMETWAKMALRRPAAKFGLLDPIPLNAGGNMDVLWTENYSDYPPPSTPSWPNWNMGSLPSEYMLVQYTGIYIVTFNVGFEFFTTTPNGPVAVQLFTDSGFISPLDEQHLQYSQCNGMTLHYLQAGDRARVNVRNVSSTNGQIAASSTFSMGMLSREGN